MHFRLPEENCGCCTVERGPFWKMLARGSSLIRKKGIAIGSTIRIAWAPTRPHKRFSMGRLAGTSPHEQTRSGATVNLHVARLAPWLCI